MTTKVTLFIRTLVTCTESEGGHPILLYYFIFYFAVFDFFSYSLFKNGNFENFFYLFNFAQQYGSRRRTSNSTLSFHILLRGFRFLMEISKFFLFFLILCRRDMNIIIAKFQGTHVLPPCYKMNEKFRASLK